MPFSITLFFLLSACNQAHESPVIYFSNASEKPIKEINCEWTNEHLLSLPKLNPGESRSLPFNIDNGNYFFGLVKLSWINSSDEKISGEFFFNKENLPSINDKTTYNYVQFYLDQNGYEVLTSDSVDLSNKTNRMDKLLSSYKKDFIKNSSAKNETDPNLIQIENKKSTLPNWLTTSY